MPHLTLPLDSAGGVIPLLVGVTRQREAALIAAKRPVPSRIQIRGMIDTGASATAIDPAIVAPLGLTPTGSMSVHTPSTQGQATTLLTYDVWLGVHHASSSLIRPSTPVLCTHLAASGIDALLGRDFMSQCLLLYDGAAKTFTLAF